MKTMTFYTPDDDLGLDVLVGMLLALPRGGKHDYYVLDKRRDGRYTVAARHADGNWIVSFRPAGVGTLGHYDNPAAAARAIIARDHAPYAVRVSGAADVTADLLEGTTVCEPAPEPLTDTEQALRGYLIGVARRLDPAADIDTLVAGLPGYQQVRDIIDPGKQVYKGHRCTGMGGGLRAISALDRHHGVPTVTALIKLARAKYPSVGWWDAPDDAERSWDELVADWHQAVRAAVTYWHDQEG
jgi:hypothetical protein